jgi:hypothetical protein
MKRFKLNIVLFFILISSISGCGQSTQKPQAIQAIQDTELTEYSATAKQADSKQTSVKQTLPDARLAFIAQTKPLLDKESRATVLAASKAQLKPKVVVKEVEYPRSLLFAEDDTLYVIGDYDQNAIVEIKPSYHSRVVARSGWMADTLRDDGTKAPIYNGFLGLSFTLEGNLLTLRNEAYPFEVNIKTGNQAFVGYILPDKKQILSVEDDNAKLSLNNLDWQIHYIQSDSYGRLVILNDQIEDKKWYRYHKGQKLEEVKNLLELPPAAYLLMHTKEGSENWNGETYTLGADGYIYAVETHFEFKDHRDDRVIRIGDAGLSSLRKEATRTVIAEFKHGTLTGALSFNAKGELAVGALNAIYLISPTNSSTNTK